MNYHDLWKLFEQHNARDFATFAEWCAKGGLRGELGSYMAEKLTGGWAEDYFRTFHRIPVGGYIAKPLSFPEARTVADLFDACKLIPQMKNPQGGRTLDEGKRWIEQNAGGPGFVFFGGSRSRLTWCGHPGATWEYDEARNTRTIRGGSFASTYAKPKPAVLKWWENTMGSEGDFSLGGFEAVDRDDGILVIARSRCGIGDRWVALLDAGQDLFSLAPQADRDLIQATEAAEASAFGHLGGASARAPRYPATDAPPPPTPRTGGPSPGPGAAIPVEVLAVLSRCATDGPRLVLPGEQLARPLYEAVNKVLATMGGKWNRRAGAHLFEGDAGDVLESLLLTGRYRDTKAELQQFYTPADLARRVVEAAGVQPGELVLEPSAGRGAIAQAAQVAGGRVTCMEIHRPNVEHLDGLGFYNVAEGDFLQEPADPAFDCVVMNPPFTKRQDVRHVTHAMGFLRPGGRLAAIMSAAVEYRDDQTGRDFRALVEHHGGTIERLPANSFGEAGTSVSTVLVTMTKREG